MKRSEHGHGRGCVFTGHRPLTRAQETRSSEFPKRQHGARFLTYYSKASAHQAVNREKREERCSRRVGAAEIVRSGETGFGKRFRMSGVFFFEGIQILGVHTNKGVTRENRGLVRGPDPMGRQDNETEHINVGRRVRSKFSGEMRDVRNGTSSERNHVRVKEKTSTQCSQSAYRQASNFYFTRRWNAWLG